MYAYIFRRAKFPEKLGLMLVLSSNTRFIGAPLYLFTKASLPVVPEVCVAKNMFPPIAELENIVNYILLSSCNSTISRIFS